MRSIRTRLTITYSVLAVILTLVLLTFIGFSLQEYFYGQLVSRLERETTIVDLVLTASKDRLSWTELRSTLDALADSADMRVTLIASDGVVLYESSIPDSLRILMENHLYRPEVQMALVKGIGTNFRHSATLNIDMVYAAKKVEAPGAKPQELQNLGYVRVGLTSALVYDQIKRIWFIVILGGVLATASLILVSRLVAARITGPLTKISAIVQEIRDGDLEKRLPVVSNDEIGRLAESINEMTGKLRDDIDRLRRLERFRSEFLGNVSHELRTPIFSLKGFLETLLEGAIDDKSVNRNFVDKAYRHASRLDALLSDLIEISRIESGDMKMSFRYFDVVPFMETLREDFVDEAKKKGQSLLIHVPSEEILVYGDRDRLRQALGSIVDNAVKYSPENSPIILRVSNLDQTVRIAVEDHGPGIAPEHVERIFERFYRVDKNRSRAVGGTGLGLAIAKHIVEAHGSKIHVQSAPEKGSLFYFDLKK